MPCLMIQLNIKQRHRLGNTLALLCVVQVLSAWITCLCVVYFEYSIKWAADLVGYSSHFLQNTITATGLASFIVYSLGAKIYFDSGHEKTRSRFTTVFSLWNVILYLLCITKIVTICYSHWCMASFPNPFRTGFLAAIGNYLNDTTIKEHVDYLQSEYKCCGADSFIDWMDTPWMPSDYTNLVKPGDRRFRNYYNDTNSLDQRKLAITPFSCCNLDRLGPCIHDYITQESFAETIKYEWGLGHSLWEKGCGEIFESVYNGFLNFVCRLTLASFCCDVIMMILFRYLRTSVEMLELSPNHRGIAPGWCCNCSAPKIIELENVDSEDEVVYSEKSKKRKHKLKKHNIPI